MPILDALILQLPSALQCVLGIILDIVPGMFYADCSRRRNLQRVRILEELLRETPLELSSPAPLTRQATMPASLARLHDSTDSNHAPGSASSLLLSQHHVPSPLLHRVESSSYSTASTHLRTGSPRTITPITALTREVVASEAPTESQQSMLTNSRPYLQERHTDYTDSAPFSSAMPAGFLHMHKRLVCLQATESDHGFSLDPSSDGVANYHSGPLSSEG